MNNLFDEMILSLLDRGMVKEMVDLPEQVFEQLLETIQRKRQEHPDLCYDRSNPGSLDTPEG